MPQPSSLRAFEEDVMRTTALAAACVIACAALAACSTGAHPRSGSAAQPDTEIESIVQCYRAHGDPGFPDPVYDPSDGRWHFAVSPATAPMSTRQACQHLFPSVDPSPPVPQAQFAKLVQFADCMRRHGEPTWPDPLPDGAFPFPASQLDKGKRAPDPAGQRAFAACQKYLPSGHYSVVAV
jgi:hypothetical protein